MFRRLLANDKSHPLAAQNAGREFYPGRSVFPHDKWNTHSASERGTCMLQKDKRPRSVAACASLKRMWENMLCMRGPTPQNVLTLFASPFVLREFNAEMLCKYMRVCSIFTKRWESLCPIIAHLREWQTHTCKEYVKFCKLFSLISFNIHRASTHFYEQL